MNDEEHNFYLTHIRFNNEDIINNINQKEIWKKNIKKKYIHSPNTSFINTRQNFISKLKVNNLTFDNFKQNFVKYLIDEQINYAKFDEIETYYINEIRNNHYKYNNNLIELKKKKQEYKDIINIIEKELKNHYFSRQNGLEEYYKVIINNYKKIIQIQSHELNCYNNMYKRSYRTKILIKNRINNEYELEAKNQEQFQKYIILRDHGLLDIKKQRNLLKKFHNILEMNIIEYKSLFDKKKEQLNQLEYQVSILKNYKSNYYTSLEKIEEKKIKILNKIKKKNNLNKLIFNENRNLLSIYISTKYDILKLYHSLNINHLDIIIMKMNNYQNKQFRYKLDFQALHKQIRELTLKYFELCYIYNNVQKNLENNRRLILIKNKQEMNLKKENFEYLFQNVKDLKKRLFTKEQFVILMLRFIIKYSNQIYNSLKLDNISIGEHKYNDFFLDSKNIDKNLIQKLKEYNKESIKFFLYLFNYFSNSLYLMVSNTFNKSCRKNDYLFSKPLEQYEVVNFSSDKIESLFEKKVQLTFKHLQKKNQIFSRTNVEIFNSIHNLETSAEKKENKITKNLSLEELYNDFMINCQNKFIKQNNFIKYHPNTSMLQIKRFIIEKPKKQKEKLPKFKRFSNNSLISKKRLFNPFSKRYINKKYGTGRSCSIDNIIDKEYNYVYDDKFDTDNDEKNEKTIKKKETISRLFSPKNEKNQMDNFLFFSRMNDLRNLEHQYNENNKNVLNPNEFNKIYHNLNKKFLKNKIITSLKKKNIKNKNFRSNSEISIFPPKINQISKVNSILSTNLNNSGNLNLMNTISGYFQK